MLSLTSIIKPSPWDESLTPLGNIPNHKFFSLSILLFKHPEGPMNNNPLFHPIRPIPNKLPSQDSKTGVSIASGASIL